MCIRDRLINHLYLFLKHHNQPKQHLHLLLYDKSLPTAIILCESCATEVATAPDFKEYSLYIADTDVVRIFMALNAGDF